MTSPMPPPIPTALAQLSRAYGVQTSYLDMRNETQHATPEALLAILRSMGATSAGGKLDTPADAPAALRAYKERDWQQIVEPVTVIWEGDPLLVELKLPAKSAAASIEFQLTLETEKKPLSDSAQPGAPEAKPQKIGAIEYVRVPLAIPLATALPLGYHTLKLTTPAGAAETLIIHAPRKAYQSKRKVDRRAWGGFLPLYALRSKRDAGVGDFTDLQVMMEWLRAHGGTAASTLPLLAAFLGETSEQPFEYSPYTPASRLFWNELYIDPERAPEMADCPEAQAILHSEDYTQARRTLAGESFVDYRRAMALRRQILEPLARAFTANVKMENSRQAAFEAFAATSPQYLDYARFRATCERRAASWQTWPEPQRSGKLTAADYDQSAVDYHVYVQFLAHEQLTRLTTEARKHGPGLYLDMPLGVHSDSYDVWRERAIFAQGVSGGAPPDSFFAGGQDWGFQPLDPHAIRRQGYRHLIQVYRQQMRQAGILRIDHAMGLHRLFWIPQGQGARAGVYVHYNSNDIFAILCLESQRHQTMLVGEDLGTVPPVVRTLMTRHELSRLYVGQFEMRPNHENALTDLTRRFVASMNTHDIASFAAFWLGKDLDLIATMGILGPDLVESERRQRWACQDAVVAYLQRLGLIGPNPPTETILAGCLKLMAASPSPLLLINLEDLWLETEPQNIPGTWREVPNWRRKSAKTLEEFTHDPQINSLLREIDRRRRAPAALSSEASRSAGDPE